MQIQLGNHAFTIDPGQNKMYWSLINSRDWEPHTFGIYNAFVTKDSNVLDIGAWSGVLTLYAAKIAKHVIALDPDPICFDELNTNVNLNPNIAFKIKTYKVAISDKKEIIKLSARDTYGASSSSILERKRDKQNSLTLETISLNEFLESENIQHIDFIKMDVEGAEFKILPSIGKALKKLNHPTLFISFHYSFLNEYMYYKHVPFGLLNKILLRFEDMIGFNLFKHKIRKQISNLFDDLKSYDFIYKTDGSQIYITDLLKNPEIIKDTDLVFTNKKWDKSL